MAEDIGISGKNMSDDKGGMPNVNLRAIVLDILLENENKPGHSHIILRRALDKYQYLDKPQRAFVTRLSEGAIEKRIELDWIIDQVSNTRVTKMKPVIREIMRLSTYQMKYMDNVPVSAVCNEAVKLAQSRGFSSLKGFVNGVLRNISRQLDNMQIPSEEKSFEEYCMISYSMPKWLVEHFIDETSKECAKRIFEAFDMPKKTYVRCNLNKISPEGLKKRLEGEGVTVKDTVVPYAFELADYDYLQELNSFNEGLFQVQDLSSILSGLLIMPRKGDFIVDVCAAPGGKCIHASQRGDVVVQARDVSQSKVDLILDNIERMEANNVTTKVWDATCVDLELNDKVDCLIADVPCSGLGILGRKADIRYTVTKEGIDELVKLQREILTAVSGYVKEGGTLIYSTCTINSRENVENVLWFIKNFPYELVSIENELSCLDRKDLSKGYLQLLPGVDGTDGFFMAKLRKKSNL